MGLMSFFKNAGAKLFGKSDADKAKEIQESIQKLGLEVKDLSISLNGDKVTVAGEAISQEVCEKVLLAAGNNEGIAEVDNQMTVAEAVVEEAEPVFYTVKSGDYLSKISKEVYGDASKYNVIFEANKPMLQDPDKIYPGQMLRIPKL